MKTGRLFRSDAENAEMKMLQNAENNRRIILFLENNPEQWWEMLKMNDEGGGVGPKWKWMMNSFFNLIYFQGPVAEIIEELSCSVGDWSWNMVRIIKNEWWGGGQSKMRMGDEFIF